MMFCVVYSAVVVGILGIVLVLDFASDFQRD